MINDHYDQGILELHFFSKLCPVDHFWKCAYMRLSLSNQEGILVRNAFEFSKKLQVVVLIFWLFLSIRMLSFTTEACFNRINLCVALTNHKKSTLIRRSPDQSRLFICSPLTINLWIQKFHKIICHEFWQETILYIYICISFCVCWVSFELHL